MVIGSAGADGGEDVDVPDGDLSARARRVSAEFGTERTDSGVGCGDGASCGSGTVAGREPGSGPPD